MSIRILIKYICDNGFKVKPNLLSLVNVTFHVYKHVFVQQYNRDNNIYIYLYIYLL